MSKWIVTAVFALFLVLALRASAQPMRCGTQIIEPGNTMERVLYFCGRPQAARQWTVTIPAGDDDEGWIDAAQIPMAEWDYDADPDDFPSKVIFKDGVVQEIRG